MTFTKRMLSLALALVVLVSTFAFIGTINASALSGVGTDTSFKLSKANHTFGCDISSYNVLRSKLAYERVDFAKMKASGCDFVILRIGLNLSSDHKCYIDDAFLGYYERARAAGMKLGVYFYSRARTVTEATTEAEFVIKTIEDHDMYFEYPIYYDVESEEQLGGKNPSGVTYTALSMAALETVCTTFMTKLESAGYYPAMYCMKALYERFSTSFKSKYDFWGAHVRNKEGLNGLDSSALKKEDPYSSFVDENGKIIDYSNTWTMWQYSWYGHKQFSGYTYDSSYAQLDVNLCYKDYPALMLQYGYNNCSTPSNGSLVAGKTPTITGSYQKSDAKGSGLTDGKLSKNLDDGTWLALNDKNQYTSGYVNIDYDLGAKYTLTDAKMHFGIKTANGIDRPYDIKVLVSDDKTTWTEAGIFTVTAGAWADGYHTFSATDLKGAGRYVRFAMMNSGWLYINEIFLNGTAYTAPSTPSEPSTPPATSGNGSLVDGKAHSITGSYQKSEAKGSGLTDGKYSNDINDGTWLALNSKNQVGGGYVNIDYDLGAKYTLSNAKLYIAVESTDGIGRPYDLRVQVSDDNKTWKDAGLFEVVAGAWADGKYTVSANNLDGAGRYVRFTMLNSEWLFINEIVLNGTKYVEPTGNKTLSGSATVIIPNAADAKYNACLNDGLAAGYKDVFTDGCWYGFAEGKNADADGYAEIIFDLGARYDISQVRLHLANSAAAGICNPWEVTLSVSDSLNGPYTTYSKQFGTLTTTTADDFANEGNAKAYWSDMPNITGMTGRYVKISFYVGGSWMFINEVDINGTAAKEPEYNIGDIDNNGVIDADDYITLKRIYFGTAKLESLGSPETASARCDVNKDGKIDADDYITLKRVYFGNAKI